MKSQTAIRELVKQIQASNTQSKFSKYILDNLSDEYKNAREPEEYHLVDSNPNVYIPENHFLFTYSGTWYTHTGLITITGWLKILGDLADNSRERTVIVQESLVNYIRNYGNNTALTRIITSNDNNSLEVSTPGYKPFLIIPKLSVRTKDEGPVHQGVIFAYPVKMPMDREYSEIIEIWNFDRTYQVPKEVTSYRQRLKADTIKRNKVGTEPGVCIFPSNTPLLIWTGLRWKERKDLNTYDRSNILKHFLKRDYGKSYKLRNRETLQRERLQTIIGYPAQVARVNNPETKEPDLYTYSPKSGWLRSGENKTISNKSPIAQTPEISMTEEEEILLISLKG